MKRFFTFISVVAIIAAVAGKNYCDMPCKDHKTGIVTKHIGCGHNKLFDKNCPSNAKMAPMTDALKTILLDNHNEKRNFIAGGGDANHERACRMATMQWDDELASLAELNVKQCKMKHDNCHNTNTFQYSGQNLATAWEHPAGAFSYSEELKVGVQNWFNEVKYSKQSIIDSFPENYFGPQIGHFTVMMADRNNRIGCGAAAYNATGRSNILIACNYATHNMPNFPIYNKCEKTGQNCKSGKNPKYPNLCSEEEEYDVNKWF